jgi:hypothetical membrane protein
MKEQQPISFFASLIALFAYLAFALLAFSQFPGIYSPLSNWLSDLGNIDLNPKGAVFYNTGVISTGILLVLFFAGLVRWKMPARRVQKAMLLTTQVFGLLGSLAMVMSAVYPINHIAEHRFWSISLYILLGTAFVFSVFAFRYHSSFPRWVLALGIVIGAVDISSGIFQSTYWIEWVTVALFLGYILIIGIETRAVRAALPSG